MSLSITNVTQVKLMSAASTVGSAARGEMFKSFNPHNQSPGAIVAGRYKLEEHIGRGNFSVCYRCVATEREHNDNLKYQKGMD